METPKSEFKLLGVVVAQWVRLGLVLIFQCSIPAGSSYFEAIIRLSLYLAKIFSTFETGERHLRFTSVILKRKLTNLKN